MRGIPVLAAAYGAAAGANLLLTVTVGRSLGAAALGTFALAVAIARVFFAATDLGIATDLTRTIAQDPTTAVRAAPLLRFRMLLIVPAIAVVWAVGTAIGDPAAGCYVFVAIALGLVSLHALYEAVLLALGRHGAVAALTLTGSGCVAVGCVAALTAELDLASIAAVYAAATLLAAIAWGGYASARLGVWPHRDRDPHAARRVIARSWRIGASALLAIAALRAPTLVLGLFEPPRELGPFVAVDTLVTAPGILQVAITNASFPRLAASFQVDPTAFRAAFWRSNALLALAGVTIGLGLAIVGDDLLGWLFPSRDFRGVSTLMPIVACSLPALLLVHHNIAMFAASNNEALNLRVMIGWFALIATAQLVMVPLLGSVGAAWGVLVARGVGLVLLAATVARAAAHRGGDA